MFGDARVAEPTRGTVEEVPAVGPRPSALYTVAMRSRSLRILLLAVFSLWFGVIVPGHERGAICVPGADTDSSKSCHAEKTCGSCHETPADSQTPADDPNPSSHCAICHLIGVLDAPTTIHFVIPEAELLACLPLPSCDGIAAVALLSTHRDRGPPILFI